MRLTASIIVAARVDGVTLRPFVDPVAEWIVDRLRGTDTPRLPVTTSAGDIVDCPIAKDTLKVEVLSTGEPVVRFEIDYEGALEPTLVTPPELVRAAAVSEAAAKMFDAEQTG